MNKQYVVFGLGRFGGNLVKALAESDSEVLAVDQDYDKVQEYSKYATQVVRANALDESVLRNLGVKNFDHASVSFGDNIEASILTSLMLKESGVPIVWSKAQSDYHSKLLEKIGVDRVIQPERDTARRIAKHIVSDKLIDFIELSSHYSMAEIIASEKLDGKSLVQLSIRSTYGCVLMGIQRGEEIMIAPPAEALVQKGDILYVIGRNEDINRFEEEGV